MENQCNIVDNDQEVYNQIIEPPFQEVKKKKKKKKIEIVDCPEAENNAASQMDCKKNHNQEISGDSLPRNREPDKNKRGHDGQIRRNSGLDAKNRGQDSLRAGKPEGEASDSPEKKKKKKRQSDEGNEIPLLQNEQINKDAPPTHDGIDGQSDSEQKFKECGKPKTKTGRSNEIQEVVPPIHQEAKEPEGSTTKKKKKKKRQSDEGNEIPLLQNEQINKDAPPTHDGGIDGQPGPLEDLPIEEEAKDSKGSTTKKKKSKKGNKVALSLNNQVEDPQNNGAPDECGGPSASDIKVEKSGKSKKKTQTGRSNEIQEVVPPIHQEAKEPEGSTTKKKKKKKRQSDEGNEIPLLQNEQINKDAPPTHDGGIDGQPGPLEDLPIEEEAKDSKGSTTKKKKSKKGNKVALSLNNQVEDPQNNGAPDECGGPSASDIKQLW